MLLHGMHHGQNVDKCLVKKFPVAVVPCKTTIYKTVEEFQTTGLVLEKKKIKKKMLILTEEKLHDIGT
jgi:hypothetical protein